jgi:hypothetical protein
MTDQTTPSMQLAEILSDLVSLRVCVLHFPQTPPYLRTANTNIQDPNAALALVSARPQRAESPPAAIDDQDPDLTRAKDLLKLHYDVKEKHKRGELSRGLEQARRDVERVRAG